MVCLRKTLPLLFLFTCLPPPLSTSCFFTSNRNNENVPKNVRPNVCKVSCNVCNDRKIHSKTLGIFESILVSKLVELAVCRCSSKKVLLQILQNLQENTWRASPLFKKRLWFKNVPANTLKVLKAPILKNTCEQIHFRNLVATAHKSFNSVCFHKFYVPQNLVSFDYCLMRLK